jgi:NLI interacting factor-like phosphatase
MRQSGPLSNTLASPKHILVVIDLNGTLLYRPSRKSPTVFVPRPFADQFLRYCIQTFKVVIWSSARPDNVRGMCRRLLTKEVQDLLVATWGRDKFGLTQDDYNMRVQCYKRLASVWNDAAIQASHPDAAAGARWNQTNTVLVDDSAEKARSEPFNFVQVPEFLGKGLEQDYVLPQVHDYLNSLCFQENVSSFIRQNPFVPSPNYTLERGPRP